MWERWNQSTKIFEKSTNNGASWTPLGLDASIITQGVIDSARLPPYPPSSGGDVVGPAGAADNTIPLYSGVTGKLIKGGSSLYAGGGNSILGLGGLGAANPAIRANATTVEVVRGDQALYCDLRANNLYAQVSIGAPTIVGLTYVAYTPVLTTTATATTVGNATAFGRYWKIGDLHFFYAQWQMGSTSVMGTGQIRLSYPTTMSDASHHCLVRLANAAGTGHWAWGQAASGSIFNIFYGQGTLAGIPLAAVTPTAPFTWTAGAIIIAQGFYLGS